MHTAPLAMVWLYSPNSGPNVALKPFKSSMLTLALNFDDRQPWVGLPVPKLHLVSLARAAVNNLMTCPGQANAVTFKPYLCENCCNSKSEHTNAIF